MHYTLSTRKSCTKVVINPLSVSPAKWSNTLKQFVGSLSWYFRLQGGTFERLLRACGFKPNTLWLWFLPDLYDLPESMNIIWFHNKIWRHDGVTTALWQDQIIVVVCPIFFKCLNKLWCLVNRGFYPQQRLIKSFKKKIKKKYFLYHVFPLLLQNNTTISPQKRLLTKIVI